ncbi:MAG: DNA primase [Clostridia bacterium]|nr:DNA primase [Clostridia bacterium]
MIPKEVIEEIRYRCDIEDVIGSYVTLKRAGSNRNGLCPFHSEKTPSFTVFPNTKSFYCFGCGAGGDVITFIQKIENLDYVGSLEFLAARAGINIPNDAPAVGKEGVSRKRIYDMNLEAAKFFRGCLFDPVLGQEGMRYLSERRSMSGAVIKRFGLGFAPNDFTMLTKHMRALGYTEEELIAAFLCGRSQKNGRLFDLFRNRIMFPVIDTTGNIVAFGGRVMDDSKPKYLNSADTPGFKKSRILFGLNYAKAHCAEQMILCEGYMDAIAMHAAGFENAVATLGTAITPDHARLLSRYTKKVLINYDSDEAGQKAANKAMALLDEVGLEVRVLKLTGAKDADEYIRTYGADAFRNVIEKSHTAFDFKLENVLAHHDVSQADGKIRAARELAEIIAAIGSGVERELYVATAAERLGVSKEGLSNDVKRLRSRARREMKKKESRDVLLSARSFGDRINPDAAKDPGANVAEEAVLGLALLFPEHRRALATGRVALTPEDFFTDFGKRVFTRVMEMENSADGFHFSALGEYFSPDEVGRLVKLQQDRQSLANNDESVLAAAAEALRDKREKRQALSSGDWQSEIARRRAAFKKKQDNE